MYIGYACSVAYVQAPKIPLKFTQNPGKLQSVLNPVLMIFLHENSQNDGGTGSKSSHAISYSDGVGLGLIMLSPPPPQTLYDTERARDQEQREANRKIAQLQRSVNLDQQDTVGRVQEVVNLKVHLSVLLFYVAYAFLYSVVDLAKLVRGKKVSSTQHVNPIADESFTKKIHLKT